MVIFTSNDKGYDRKADKYDIYGEINELLQFTFIKKRNFKVYFYDSIVLRCCILWETFVIQDLNIA